MDIIGLWGWKILSFLLSFLGSIGEKVIDSVEKPRLKIKPFTDIREWIYDGVNTGKPPIYYGGTVTPGEAYTPSKSKEPRFFVHLIVRNESKYRGRNSTAQKVFVKLTFFKFQSNELLLPNVYGRWAESIQPPQALDLDSLKYIDILPEDQKTLDLATRYYIHNDWYAVSTQSYTADQFENSALLIKEEDFRLKVEISGANVEKETHWFVIYNKGIDGKPQAYELKTKAA